MTSQFLSPAMLGVLHALWPVVLESAFDATLLLSASFVILRALRNVAASVRHRVLALTVIAVLVLPAVNAVTGRVAPIVPLGLVALGAPLQVPLGAADEAPLHASQSTLSPADGPSEGGRQGHAIESADAHMRDRHSTVAEEDGDELAAIGDSEAVAQSRLAAFASKTIRSGSPHMDRPGSWATVCSVLWLGGFLAGVFSILRSFLGSRIRLSDARLMEGPQWVGLANAISGQLGYRGMVRIVCSSRVRIPLTTGVLRPTIVLPDDSDTWPKERCRAVLTHELAHVMRRDVFWQWLAKITCTVYWFHPMAWIAASRLRVERENACDDVVLESGALPSRYASVLVDLATYLAESRPSCRAIVAPLVSNSVEERVRTILRSDLSRTPVRRSLGVVLLCGMVVAVLCAGVVSPIAATPVAADDENVTEAPSRDAELSKSTTIAEYRGPYDIVASKSGDMLYVVEKDANVVGLLDPLGQRVTGTIAVPATPTGICISPDGASLYVTCAAPEGTVCVIDAESREISARIRVGHSPQGPCVSPDGTKLYVCNRFDDNVSVVDLKARKEVARVACDRQPYDAAVTPDGRTVFVTNHLPNDPSDLYEVAAEVTCIDTATNATTSIRLVNGTTRPAGICVSPDGKFVYAVATLARYQMPTTQLERGWMNTNALIILDAREKKYFNTVLLDDIDLGAANPHGVATSSDGSQLFVTHAGTHELSVIDAPALIKKLLALPTDREALRAAGSSSGTKRRGSSLTAKDVPNDLAFLRRLRQRIALTGNGPRGLAVLGDNVYAAMYYTDTVDCVDLIALPQPKVTEIAVGPTPALKAERQGDLYFHDATLCHEHWQSCATCHPDGRCDALNWDLMNDGLGNPKNGKSLLLAHHTPPAMTSGILDDAETAVRSCTQHLLFAVPSDEEAEAIDAYLKSLKPVPSPHLVNGQLSESAKRGRALFEGDEVGCAICHPARLYSDLSMHDVGTRGQYDRRDTFDTPTLVEAWRTAPYLHDGHYVTLEELLKEGDHGKAADKLGDEQMQDLIEYVLSL